MQNVLGCSDSPEGAKTIHEEFASSDLAIAITYSFQHMLGIPKCVRDASRLELEHAFVAKLHQLRIQLANARRNKHA